MVMIMRKSQNKNCYEKFQFFEMTKNSHVNHPLHLNEIWLKKNIKFNLHYKQSSTYNKWNFFPVM